MSISAAEASRLLKTAIREDIRRRSMLLFVQGALLTIAGLVAAIFPPFAGAAALVVLGWVLVAGGVTHLISLLALREAATSSLHLVSAVLYVLVGILLLTHIGEGLVIVTALLLVTFMIGGMGRIVFAMLIRPLPNWTYILASGVVAILCSFLLFASLPAAAGWVLGVLLALNLITFGAAEMVLAWKLRERVQTPPADPVRID